MANEFRHGFLCWGGLVICEDEPKKVEICGDRIRLLYIAFRLSSLEDILFYLKGLPTFWGGSDKFF